MGLLSLHRAHEGAARQEGNGQKLGSPLAGIYVGCVMNYKVGVYEFLVHDRMRIRSTTENLKIVGDCFPFKISAKEGS
jgi:hypothetical protein